MDMIARKKRIMMQAHGDVLPSGYRKIAYIASDGNQYILFPLLTIDLVDIGFETKFMYTASLGGNRTFSSTRIGPWSSAQYSVNAGLTSYNGYRLVTDNRGGYLYNYGTDIGYNVGDVATFSLHGNTMNYNGTEYAYQRIITGQLRSALVIFGSQASNAVSEIPAARCYYYRVFDGDEKVLDCIPCVRKSDSKPGMYDTVSNTFYTNAGTGEFIIPQ